MAGQQRVYKQRIRSTETLKKVFRAMELIAASRIGKARSKALESTPYANALGKALSAVVAHARLTNPLLVGHPESDAVAVLVITSDRGMAGSYSASVLRAAEKQIDELEASGKKPVLYVAGRRGASYFRFRGREVAREWEGHSDAPQPEEATQIADELYELFTSGAVGSVVVIYTRFVTMVRQVVEVRRLIPLEVVDEDTDAEGDLLPLYEFEPNADDVLEALLPLYVRSRIYNNLLHAAASELASRQQAMHTATENAEDLIRTYTRLANTARQAEITQEITEIVSGADALASS